MFGIGQHPKMSDEHTGIEKRIEEAKRSFIVYSEDTLSLSFKSTTYTYHESFLHKKTIYLTITRFEESIYDSVIQFPSRTGYK